MKNKNENIYYFITIIEKDFYNERNMEYIPKKMKNINISEFKYIELFQEEIIMNNKSYLKKCNSISFESSDKLALNNNLFLFKIKDGTKVYLYDCLMNYDIKNNNGEKSVYFIYNFEIGELIKNNLINNESIIVDSLANLQTSLIEMKENFIPQIAINFDEKFLFFLKAIKNNSKEVDLIINLLLDSFKEIEISHTKSKTKIQFIKLLKLLKIIYEDIYIKNIDNTDYIFQKFLNLFDVLLINKLIFYDKIDDIQLKEFVDFIKSIEQDNIISEKFIKFIALFYGYYENEEKVLDTLDKNIGATLSNLYISDLYDTKNGKIKQKLTYNLFINSKNFEEFLLILNKSNSFFEKLDLVIIHFDLIKKLIENNQNKENFPIKFEDNIKAQETPNLFYPIHKKIISLELELIKKIQIKSIFDFSEIIKKYINIYESLLGTKENYQSLLTIKQIILEENKINPDKMENIYKYINKLIHLNIIEMVKLNIIDNIELLNQIYKDEYFTDELYNLNDEDYIILNGFKIQEILSIQKEEEFFKLFNKYEIWKIFCKNKENIKKYFQFFEYNFDNILNLELFYKILPIPNYNYPAVEGIISWVESNIMTLDLNILKNRNKKEYFFYNLNILFNLCIKTHFEIETFFSILEIFFIEKIKNKYNKNNDDEINGFEILNELFVYFINNYNTENNNSIPYKIQKIILSFYSKNYDIKIHNKYLLIIFLNNVIIDKQHLEFEQLLNNIENLILSKFDLLSNNNLIKYEIFKFLIDKYKPEFDDKKNNNNYLMSTRKIVKNFIIKDIEQKLILYDEASILFNNGNNLDKNKEKIINKFLLCSKIKKNENNEENKNIELYESIYKDLLSDFLNCKNIVDNMEKLYQYYLYFGNENINANDIKEIKEIINKLKNLKIKDFFKEENIVKVNKFKNLFEFSNKAIYLKNSLIFMKIYDEVIKKLNDPNIKMNNSSEVDINQKITIALGTFNQLSLLFKKFINCNSDSFIHPYTEYFYNIELENKGGKTLNKEVEFLIDYFRINSKNQEEEKLFQNFDKDKFVDFIKNLTKIENILLKCKGINHIINIFLNPENYIYINKEEEKIEKQINVSKFLEMKNEPNSQNESNNWNRLDFEKNYINKSNPEINKNSQNKNIKLKEELKNKLKNKLNNSEFRRKINEYLEKIKDIKISLNQINEIGKELDSFNLGINVKESLNNEQISDKQKLNEDFFILLIEKPEAIFFAKLKKSNEIKNLFQNTCVEIENTLLKDEDINDLIFCIEKVNNFSLNIEKMINEEKVYDDLPKEIVSRFIKELNDNNYILLKSAINYLKKFNQLKSILNEIIASPEVSIKKITKILDNSDFIINYDTSNNKYLLYGNYYESIKNSNDIKEISISYEELENLRERILTLSKNIKIYKDTLLFAKIFTNIKKVLKTLIDLDRAGYPDKINIIINIKNKKINCNYDNRKFFNNLKDLTNSLIEQKNIQIKLFEKYYKNNEIFRLFYGKQISSLYNYIRFKENQDYVDSLFQLISNGKITVSYPPEYKNYSENLFEDIIKNVCEYSLLVFESNQIIEPKNIFNSNKIKIKDEKNENYKGIYLHLSSIDFSEKEILSYYNKFTNNPPLISTILLCNSYTTEEEIIAFLYRSILCTENVLFVIVNANILEPKQRNLLLNTIKQLINELALENKEMNSSLIVFSTESNSEIFRVLKNFDEPEHPIKLLYFDEIDNNLNTNKINICSINLNNFRIIKSDSSGVGKSRFIRNLPGVYESNLIYLPLGGNISKKSIFLRIQTAIKKLNVKNLTQIFIHIDLNQTNEQKILKDFFFDLFIFKKISMSSKESDKIIYMSNKFQLYIELPYGSLNKLEIGNFNNYFSQFYLFSLVPKPNITDILLNNLKEFYEEMSEEEKKNLIMNPGFEYIKTLSDSPLQLISKTLESYDKKTIDSTVILPTSTDKLSNVECNKLLNKFLTKIHLPNFYQKNIFIRLLFNQFLYFHQNYNLDPKILIKNAKKLKLKDYKNITEIRAKIIKNLIDHAVFFTNGFSENIMKSQERTKEILQIQDYNQRKKLTEELKERENISKLRYEKLSPSLILFQKEGYSCKIIPTCQKKSEEELFLNILEKLLKVPKEETSNHHHKITNKILNKLNNLKISIKKEEEKPLEENLLKYPIELSSSELMDELLDYIQGRRLSLDVINRILSEYALTPDNYIKMILILNRINSGIPVILMGETGCGKTSLIKILATIIFKGNLNKLKILNIHSGIEDNEIINYLEHLIKEVELEDKARLTSSKDEFNSLTPDQQDNYLLSVNKTKEKLFEDFEKEINQQKIWVFFDEINTSNSMGLLSEILCKKNYLGKKIPEKFVFLAACNPYRAIGELNKIDYTLIHKGQDKRKLVYTVYPLPNNMLNFVLDFGNLSLEEEKKYIQIMVGKMMQKIMNDINKKECEAIINLAINSIITCQSYIKTTNDISSVSLREVKRFVIFFKYFVAYLLNKQNDNESKEQSHIFYNSKSKYDIYKYAVNLALYICYYLRLPNHESRRELLNHLDGPNFFNNQFIIVPQLEENYITQNILESKENEILSKGIAKNRALLENLFSLYFCVVNKIPLIICGKPGTTKSLSAKLLQNALKGMVSRTKLCKETKELIVFQYQGSLNSTSEEIKEIFKKAKNYQKNNKDTIVMVYIDEMGLAEISKNNPLKVIHSELEMNFDFEKYNFGFNSFIEHSKVAFLGISNWSLDASKMNRAVFNIVQEPDLKDLKKMAVEISSSISEKISVKYIAFFDRLSKAYYEYIEQKKRDNRMDSNFHGLRDFYNLIKGTSRKLISIDKNELLSENEDYLNDIAMKNIERNFGGLKTSVVDFKVNYFKADNENADLKNRIIDNNYDVMKCISENLFDQESRYLLLITKNSFDLDLINFIIDEIIHKNKGDDLDNNFEIKNLLGSNFIKDNEEEYREYILGIIRNEIQTNNLLILKDLDIIYTSLYDLLNQDFIKIENTYYTRISFGLWKPLSIVNKKFRILVVMNENNLIYENPPFLNRFEKHIFNMDNLLTNEEKNIANEIYNIVLKITNFGKSKINLNKHLINFNLEEIEALVYKFSKHKKYFNQNIDIYYEVFKKIVPTFTEEIIASIFVSGFKEENKDIADKIINIYSVYHPSNISDFVNNKMIKQKNIIYTYSSISDELLLLKNQKTVKETNDNKGDINIINNNEININKYNLNENNNYNINEEKEYYPNKILDEKNIEFNANSTKEIYIESIKSILDLEKLIDEFLNEESKHLFVIKFSNKEKDLNKMNQINYLIDDCLYRFKSNNEQNIIEVNKKYFLLIVYLIREDNDPKYKENINKENIKNINVFRLGMISKLIDNCHQVFIDNLKAKDYDLIKTLTMKNNDLFEFYFIDELKKNIDTSFRFMTYEFSKNETKVLNRNNYREEMTEKILNNKYIQNLIKNALLKLCIGTKEILRPIFIEEDNKKNKNKKDNKIVYEVNNKEYTDFIELFKKNIFEKIEFYLIKIIFCLEKSQILHSISFNQEMLSKKIITDKIIQFYFNNELENQLLVNKISTNFNVKNKLNIILSIKVPYISKNVLIPKIINYIKEEIIFNYSNNEAKLIDIIKDNSLIEETIKDYYTKLNQLNENIYIRLLSQEMIKELIFSNDKYLIISLYHDLILLFLLESKRFEDGENFEDFYRLIDILLQLRFLNIQEDNFAFVNKNKTISLLKVYDILFFNNINDQNKNRAGIMIAKILGFLFGYQNEIYIILEIFSYMKKYIPNLINILEDIIINKEVKNEISERNPDYCRIVKESFFIVYESLLHCIVKQYNKDNLLQQNKNVNNNKININDQDSDLDSDLDDDKEDDIDINEFSLNNNIINCENDGEDKNLLKQFGEIPIEDIENISKISVLLEKKLLLYSKELFMIKNLSKVFKLLNQKSKDKEISKANIMAITNIICSEEKYIYEKNFKYLFNNLLLLFELLGRILGKDSKEFGELIIYLIINQFQNVKNVPYKVKVLNLIIPDSSKNSKTKREQNPIILENILPLLVLLFNDGIYDTNKSDKLEPLYNELTREKRKEKFLEFVKNENVPQYQLLKVINRPNPALDQIIIYYFEYLCELYFKKIYIINEKSEDLYIELLGNSSLDYLEESLLFLDDEISGNNNLGNKSNYLNKIGKLFSISFIKKYINHYVKINKDYLYQVYFWEDINDILYSKENKLRKMVKYYLLKQYSKLFETEQEFVSFNFSGKRIPFNEKFKDFKIKLTKHQFDYNIFPFMYRTEYNNFFRDLTINNFNNNKFYEFLTETSNYNAIDLFFCFYVNNFLLQNFYKDFYVDENSSLFSYLKNLAISLNIVPEEAKNLLKLLEPNEFLTKVKPLMGNKISLKQYEIFIYGLRFCLISLKFNLKNFYSNLLSSNCFKTLSESYIPGKTSFRDIFKDSYEIIKENLTKDPLSYGAYLCSCGYHYSVANCTFPTVISKCPICGEKIGGTEHKLIRRPGHIRIFLNEDSRKTKFSPSYADKTMPNMLLDEFYNNIVLKSASDELRYIDRKYAIGCDKKDFLKIENVRGLSPISFRIVNFILFSHLFIGRVMNFISNDNLNLFKVKDMSIFEALEADWDILNELLKSKKIKYVQIFFNVLYPEIYHIIENSQFFDSSQKSKNYESLLDQKINDILKRPKEIKEYEEQNSRLLDFDPLSDMAIIYQRFPPYMYKKNDFPDIEYFINTSTPDIEYFKNKFSIISNPEDKYPLLKIILTQDMDKIELLKEIPRLNKIANFLLEKCSFKYSRESANNTKIKTEKIYNEIKDDLPDFIESWKKIRPIVENYGCKQFQNNGVKYFTDINLNSPISHFLVDDGEFGHGMVLAAIYKKLIELQNIFLNQIINSKSEILSCFKEQLNQEIFIQDATLNEIIDLNRINKDILIDIIVKNTIPNIFNTLKTEKKINFDNINSFEHNYENIERELGSLLLPGLRRFKPEDIRFVTYKYEGFRGNKSNIITNFNEKYPKKELNENQINYIFKFINKEDFIDKKTKTNSFRKNIKKILFSLQLLIDYIQRENFDKLESLYDIIKKLPKQINICEEIILLFKGNDNKIEVNNDFNLLINNDNNNKSDSNGIYFSVGTLITIFEIFEHLCWDSFKENLCGDYLQKIDEAWGKKIKKYFEDIKYKQEKIIKGENLCTAIRRFISRYLTGKRGENEINENNTLLNEILRAELWKPFFTESDSFEIEIGEIMSLMTDQYDGSLKVGQALELYKLLGGDQSILDLTRIKFKS